MDIVSHGLWGGIAFGRKTKKSFLAAFLFGIAPDFLAFAPFFAGMILGFTPRVFTPGEPPPLDAIPQYIHSVYQVTHSVIIFLLAFAAVAIIIRRPLWEMLAWGLHILMDIPTHSNSFFPTPFLWPLSTFHIDGIPWGHPVIFFPNVILLTLLYAIFLVKKGREKKYEQSPT